MTAAVWLWAVPAAWFWSLTLAHGVVLPHLPRLVWIVPGEVWRVAPWAFAALIVLAPVAAWRAAARGWSLGRWRPWVVGALAIVALVALVWGGALVGGLPG